MKEKKYDIFISYRRETGADTAKHLRDVLVSKGYSVFFDTDSLRSGSFNLELINIINNCKDFILILSPNALDRCNNEDDWVRKEIASALETNRNIIPVISNKFSFPETLTEDINEIRWKNGVTVNIEYFDAMVEKLQSFLQSKPKKKKINHWLIPVIGVCVLIIIALLLFHKPSTENKVMTEEEPILSEGYIKQITQEGISALASMDYITALQRFQEAAALNDPDALYNLGYMYINGVGVKQSYEKGMKYYQMAIDQGSISALVDLGSLYYFGTGTDQSYEKALKYFQPAAEQGNARAQFAIGMMYNFGNGTDQSFEKAKEYYELAAAQDDSLALNALGHLYEDGLGVAQSYEKALEYYSLAVKMGNQTAKEDIERIEKIISTTTTDSEPSLQTETTSSPNENNISNTGGPESNSVTPYNLDAVSEFCQAWKEYYLSEKTPITLTYTCDLEGQLTRINILYNNDNNIVDYHSNIIPSEATVLLAYHPIDGCFGIYIFSDKIEDDLKNIKIDAINKELKDNQITNNHSQEDFWGFILSSSEVNHLYTKDSFSILLTTNNEQEELVISKKDNRILYEMILLSIKGSWYCKETGDNYLDKELLPIDIKTK